MPNLSNITAVNEDRGRIPVNDKPGASLIEESFNNIYKPPTQSDSSLLTQINNAYKKDPAPTAYYMKGPNNEYKVVIGLVDNEKGNFYALNDQQLKQMFGAERMGKLYDTLKKNGVTDTEMGSYKSVEISNKKGLNVPGNQIIGPGAKLPTKEELAPGKAIRRGM